MQDRRITNEVVVTAKYSGTVEIHGDENGALPQACEVLFQQLLANSPLHVIEGNTTVLPHELAIYSLHASSVSDETMTQLADVLRLNTAIKRLFLNNCDTDFRARLIAELEKELICPPELIHGHFNSDELRAHMTEYIISPHSKFPSQLGSIFIDNKPLYRHHWLLKAWLKNNKHDYHGALSILAMYVIEKCLAQYKQQASPALLTRIHACLDIVNESDLESDEPSFL